ncbi:hypothetical protein [Pseudoalteromonas marina]|uniref:hypothetical protein n=1 Tax=Pseudoalteromonas marina TaxID=267375 RepID=UPI0023F2F95B|nr:hypothetical protein [Pseudoalteromonas marina]
MSKITDAEANATSLDGLVNDNALVPTLRNGPKPSYQYLVDGWNTEFNTLIDNLDTQGDAAIVAINEDVATVDNAATVALSSINTNKETIETAAANVDLTIAELDSKYKLTMLGVDGAWASGIEFTAYNQYLVYNGTAYQPKPSTNPPYTTGAIPNLSDVQPITVNNADGIILDDGGSVQDFISDRDEVEALEVYTIGPSGDFTSINEAIKRLHNKTSFLKSGQVIELNQLSGFTMQEQLFANAIDLSMFNITSVDPVVTIDRQYLTETIPTLDYNSTPAFLAVNGGKLPIISTLYEMNTTGTPDSNTQHGVMVAWGGFVRVNRFCGVINCTGRGLYGVNGIAYARDSNFSGAGKYGCRPGNSSVFNVRGSDFSGAGDTGLYVAASLVTAVDCDLSGAAIDAVQTIGGSYVVLHRSDCSNAGRYAVWARGGVIEGDEITITGFTDRGIQADNGKFIGDGVVCDNPSGRIANAVLGGEITLTSFNPSNVSISSTIAAFTSGIVKVPSMVIQGSGAANSQFIVTSGGVIVATGTSYKANVTPNIITKNGYVINDAILVGGGLATISSGSSIVTVNHGLSEAPSIGDICITPNNTEAATSSWFVGSVNSTSFAIGLTQAAASNANFGWKANKNV